MYLIVLSYKLANTILLHSIDSITFYYVLSILLRSIDSITLSHALRQFRHVVFPLVTRIENAASTTSSHETSPIIHISVNLFYKLAYST